MTASDAMIANGTVVETSVPRNVCSTGCARNLVKSSPSKPMLTT